MKRHDVVGEMILFSWRCSRQQPEYILMLHGGTRVLERKQKEKQTKEEQTNKEN